MASRKKLVTAVPELPLALVDTNSSVMRKIDELDQVVCSTRTPNRLMVNLVTPVVEEIRTELKSLCPHYSPTNESDPFFADGKGVLCASGNSGNAILRGKLCAKVCKVADTEIDKRDVVFIQPASQAPMQATA